MKTIITILFNHLRRVSRFHSTVGTAVFLLGTASLSAVLIDVTQPGDMIQMVNGVNDGDASSGPPPAAEGVEHAIDNVSQKYLNFLDSGSGFSVEPSIGQTTITGLRLYTANDAEPRDPASFLLEGGSSLSGPWTTIASGSLALPSGRNAGGANPIDASAMFNQEVSFANSTAYGTYRLTFPTLKNAAAANGMQIGEVEFLAEANATVPDAGSTLMLMGLAMAGLAAFRRKLA